MAVGYSGSSARNERAVGRSLWRNEVCHPVGETAFDGVRVIDRGEEIGVPPQVAHLEEDGRRREG